MRDYRKIIHDDVNSLFHHWELGDCQITKSVEPDREWDYVLKLKMGAQIIHFKESCRFGGSVWIRSNTRDVSKSHA